MTLDIFIILAGMWNVFDGILSLIYPRLGHWAFVDLVRIIRAIIGLILFILGFIWLLADLVEG